MSAAISPERSQRLTASPTNATCPHTKDGSGRGVWIAHRLTRSADYITTHHAALRARGRGVKRSAFEYYARNLGTQYPATQRQKKRT